MSLRMILASIIGCESLLCSGWLLTQRSTAKYKACSMPFVHQRKQILGSIFWLIFAWRAGAVQRNAAATGRVVPC